MNELGRLMIQAAARVPSKQQKTLATPGRSTRTANSPGTLISFAALGQGLNTAGPDQKLLNQDRSTSVEHAVMGQ